MRRVSHFSACCGLDVFRQIERYYLHSAHFEEVPLVALRPGAIHLRATEVPRASGEVRARAARSTP
jgi:hypothetical protein